RRRLTNLTHDAAWLEADEAAVRERLVSAERALLEAVLDARQLEALDYGYRERIWDTHLPHIRELPRVLPGPFAEAGRRAREAVYPYTGRSGYECMPTVLSDARGPFGRNVPLAARIRGAVRETGRDTPIVTSGGIGTFEQAETILERGDADFVGAARQSLADPDWFRKIRLGYGHLVRRCEFTNYCEGLDQQHKQVTCKLWDRVDVDAPEASLTRDGKRRLAPPSWTPPREVP